jgi:hypothetical protein
MEQEKITQIIFLIVIVIYVVSNVLIWTAEEPSTKNVRCYDRYYNEIEGSICKEETGITYGEKIALSIMLFMLLLVIIYFTKELSEKQKNVL